MARRLNRTMKNIAVQAMGHAFTKAKAAAPGVPRTAREVPRRLQPAQEGRNVTNRPARSQGGTSATRTSARQPHRCLHEGIAAREGLV